MYTPGLETSPITNILIGFKVVEPRLTSKNVEAGPTLGDKLEYAF